MPEPATNPADRKYTSEHEWIKADGDEYLVGITAFAQDQLGDIVYVELPKVGDRVEAGKAFGVIESVKTASDLYAPVSGEVVAVNTELTEQPQTVNDDPYTAGWMIRIKADDPSQLGALLSADQYTAQIGD
jgi:glycine cleavage system H protein